jgi:hypothetical protein
MADEIQAPTATSTTSVPSIEDASTSDLIRAIAGSSTTKGAALGALMSNLLGTIAEPGGVVKTIDLSKYGIKPRTTTISPTRYVPFSDYGTRDVSAGMSPEMARQFGSLSGLGSMVPTSSLSSIPAFYANQQPMQISSPGAGAQATPVLEFTPRSSQKLSPLTGALLGAAAGYLVPSQGGGAGGGGGTAGGGGGYGGGDALLEFVSRGAKGLTDWLKKPPSAGPSTGSTTLPDTYYSGSSGSQPGYTSGGIDYTGGYDSSNYYDVPDYTNNDSSSYYRDGGMATPMMAGGGEVQQPSYYTYGTAVDPRQIMQQMAQNNYTETEFANGGYAHGGLHVPTVEGRHDYRAGSRVSGEGDGQSDDIPAMLADGEYVFDADTVAQLGNGSTKAGSDLLDGFREEIRSHKRSAPVNKIPPPSKSPLQYLKQAQARSKKNG